MDFIKETYDLFNHYLGEKVRGMKRLKEEHEAFKNDVAKLVALAYQVGKIEGSENSLALAQNEFRKNETAVNDERWLVNKAMAEFRAAILEKTKNEDTV